MVQSLPQLRASGAPKDRALMVFLSFDRKSLVKGLTISLVGDGKRLNFGAERWGVEKEMAAIKGSRYLYFKTETWK